MNDLYPGCTVAPLSKCNYATLPLEDATEGATSTATNGLIALAMQVLERTNATRAATPLQLTGCKPMQLGGISEVGAIFKKSCIVANPKGGNRATIIKKGKCGDCKYFLPDNIGDGSGIGTCRQGIRFTEEGRGRLPLYRNAERHCASFSNITK